MKVLVKSIDYDSKQEYNLDLVTDIDVIEWTITPRTIKCYYKSELKCTFTEEDIKPYDNKIILVPMISQELINKHYVQKECTCASKDLFWYGCRCGYKGT